MSIENIDDLLDLNTSYSGSFEYDWINEIWSEVEKDLSEKT